MKTVAIIAAAVIGLGTMASVAQARPADVTQAEYQAIVAHQFHAVQVPVKGENYYARGIPDTSPTTVVAAPSTSTDFQWGDAAIGAGALFGLVGLAAMGVGLRRHRFHLGTS